MRRALTQLIKKDEDNELQDVTTIKIASDTLIIALGSDITATVNATIAHRKNNKIKNVIIVATVNDSEIQELADNTKDYLKNRITYSNSTNRYQWIKYIEIFG